MNITITPEVSYFLDKFRRVRTQTEKLVSPLKPEDCVVQPVVDVSPPKWHLGHTTWFFEEFILSTYKKDYKRFHPKYAYLFNSYYEGAGERVQRAYRGNMTRPSVEEILAYRAYINQQMEAFLQRPDPKPAEIWDIIELGFQHEQQHQELLLYDIKYILGHNPLFPVYVSHPGANGTSNSSIRQVNYLEVKEGIYPIGYNGPDFHFDNEEDVHRVFVEPFAIADRLVSQGEYLEFVQAGGYRDYRYWLEEGWRWTQLEGNDQPMYWFEIEGKWHQFSLHGMQPLDPNLPMIHLSYYEADAFARWAGKRLPTEFEWEIACNQYAPEVPAQAHFVESGLYHPKPAKKGDFQFYGSAWEWTQSAYLPYPRYKAPEGTLGEYNGKFMVNQMVLKGGSLATPRDHIRPSYRNFFHPHLRWLFNGFRLAHNL